MKLYLVRSFNWGSLKTVASGMKQTAHTNAQAAQKEFSQRVKELKNLEVRYKVTLYMAEAAQPTTDDWVVYFETGAFNHIEFKPWKVTQSLPPGLVK